VLPHFISAFDSADSGISHNLVMDYFTTLVLATTSI